MSLLMEALRKAEEAKKKAALANQSAVPPSPEKVAEQSVKVMLTELEDPGTRPQETASEPPFESTPTDSGEPDILKLAKRSAESAAADRSFDIPIVAAAKSVAPTPEPELQLTPAKATTPAPEFNLELAPELEPEPDDFLLVPRPEPEPLPFLELDLIGEPAPQPTFESRVEPAVETRVEPAVEPEARPIAEPEPSPATKPATKPRPSPAVSKAGARALQMAKGAKPKQNRRPLILGAIAASLVVVAVAGWIWLSMPPSSTFTPLAPVSEFTFTEPESVAELPVESPAEIAAIEIAATDVTDTEVTSEVPEEIPAELAPAPITEFAAEDLTPETAELTAVIATESVPETSPAAAVATPALETPAVVTPAAATPAVATPSIETPAPAPVQQTPPVQQAITETAQDAAAPAVSTAETTQPVDTPSAAPIQISRATQATGPDTTLLAAFSSFQQGDLAAARRLYQQVLTTNPDSRDAMLGMAAVALQQGDGFTARSFYSRILTLNPNDPFARTGLLQTTADADPVQRESQLKSLAAEHTTVAAIPFALGNHYASQQRWHEAQQAYYNALLIARTQGNILTPDYAFNLGVSLERINQPRAALNFYQEALLLSQQHAPGFDLNILEQRLRYLERELP